ncbi:ATP-dependent 6-phosphofructokinase 4, chloroplastic-like isoform X3 [Asparagus officinalis]|uniref:ATP-dependent 6-phosphofructokinase 4, chloroplastic-like isoform X3 n=1 Tax=Asparagus officinalis TaxID=4686 RepID=UPI00098E2BA7|nr:ATP-dependent 6-phosphofructokinase 4, chloroplastic-like isoform X3 [Asparagus officinalis]
MGRYSGFIAMYATLASRDVDCCSIPESPFYLEGPGGLYEFVEQRLKENGHIVIVVAEGAGQDHVAQHVGIINEKDESGNRLLLDIGLWLSQKIKDHFTRNRKLPVYLKYIACRFCHDRCGDSFLFCSVVHCIAYTFFLPRLTSITTLAIIL